MAQLRDREARLGAGSEEQLISGVKNVELDS